MAAPAQTGPPESRSRLGETLAVASAFTEARSERDMDKLTANSVDGFISGFVFLSTAAMPAESSGRTRWVGARSSSDVR